MNMVVDSPSRLLIADDHSLVREGLRAMLEKESGLKVIGEAKNGREAVEMCGGLHPDIVLMDVRMPEMDGLTATKEIKARHPTICVLIVTTHENADYLLEAINVGAAGYVLKDSTRQQLISAVHCVLDGETPLNQDLVTELLRRLIDLQENQPSHSNQPRERSQRLPNSLTPREMEILSLLARGLTNRKIAETLVISAGTAKNHVQHIIAKLNVSDRTQAAVLAVEAGLLTQKNLDG